MFSSWDEWNINGRCTVHNNEKYELPAAPAVFMLKRPAAAVNPAVNKPRLSISSLDIIIKLKLC